MYKNRIIRVLKHRIHTPELISKVAPEEAVPGIIKDERYNYYLMNGRTGEIIEKL